MKRKFQLLAAALCVCALAACGHKNDNTPLTYVPADTPYVIANLKPLDSDVLKPLLSHANAQLPAQVKQMQGFAKSLDQEHKPHMASLVRELADEFDGRNIQQAYQHMGLDLHALGAIYGLGMSPVAHFQISDPKKFEAFIGRLEKAAGAPLEKATLDKLTYRHASFHGKTPLQMIVAVKDKQAVLALLPAQASPAMLRQALGLKHPEHSIADNGALEKLADSKGYLPYAVGMIDFQRFPKLIAGARDPMVKAMLSSNPGASGKLPASCQGDLARIASRMPRISVGYTTLEAKHMVMRVDVDLASDITKTLSGVTVKLPGLGQSSDAPMDFALALPLKEIRTFWTAQANAVKAKPFTCPALTDLNKSFADLGNKIQYTAVPPFNDLRGVRVIVDSLQMPGNSQTRPKMSGRLLIATDNPQGLLAMASIKAPMLRSLDVKKDGTPVALPASIQAMTGGEPAWVAMNKHALALAVGPGENAKLANALGEDSGKPGTYMSTHMDGKAYQQWIEMISKKTMAGMQKSAHGKDDADAMAGFEQNMQAAREQAKRVKSVDTQAHVDAHGLVIIEDVHLR